MVLEGLMCGSRRKACGLVLLLLALVHVGSRPTRGADCDANGVDDLLEVADGSAADCNGNGRPDACDLASPGYMGLLGSPGLPAGVFPLAVVAADLDGDGNADLATANALTDDVTVLFRDAGASAESGFAPPQALPAGRRPVAIAAGDLDGDGGPDLAVADFDSDGLTVLWNAGARTFVLPPFQIPLPPGSGPAAVTVADLDGDGRPDLLVALAASDQLGLLLGVGPGSVADARFLFSGGDLPAALAASDLDGDRAVDIAVANHGSHIVSVLWGLGGGEFDEPVAFTLPGDFPVAVVPANIFPGGTGLDLVVSYDDWEFVSVLRNDGQLFADPVQHPAGNAAFGLVVADVNGDGIGDIAVTNILSQVASVLLGRGDGSFGPPRAFPVGGRPTSLVAADLDGDGHADLAVAASATNEVSILRADWSRSEDCDSNGIPDSCEPDCDGDGRPDACEIRAGEAADCDGDGTIDTCEIASGAAFDCNSNGIPDACDILAGSPDVDRDGIPDECGADCNHNGSPDDLDIASGASFDCNSNGIPDECDLAGARFGGFAAAEPNRVGAFPLSIQTADLDGDGDDDLVVANGDSNDVSVLVSRAAQGGTGFAPAAAWAAGGRPFAVRVGDLDGDGANDIAVANVNSNDVTLLFNDAASPGAFVSRTVNAGSGPSSLAIADLLDRDGDLDIAVANLLSSTVSLLRNDGGRHFAPVAALPTGGQNPSWVEASDLDGDGDLDLVVANYGSNGISVLEHLPSGGFAAARPFAVSPNGEFPVAAVVGDIDRDGLPDIAVAYDARPFVSVLHNRGGLSFDAPVDHPCGQACFSVALGDLDGDGWLDMAGGDILANTAVVLFNDGGTLGNAVSVAAGTRPSSIAIGDLDFDGHPDVAVANSREGTVSVIFTTWRQSEDCDGDGIPDECDLAAGIATDCDENGRLDSCDLAAGSAEDLDGDGVIDRCGGRQRPGDANQDGGLDLSDPIWLLGHLFLGSHAELPCEHGTAATPGLGDLLLLDLNGDQTIDLSDAVYELTYLFNGGAPPVLGIECVRIPGCPEVPGGCGG